MAADNGIGNLREATPAESQQNRKIDVRNASRLPGVSWHKQKRQWQGQIRAGGRNIHLGRFDTAEESGRADLDVRRAMPLRKAFVPPRAAKPRARGRRVLPTSPKRAAPQPL